MTIAIDNPIAWIDAMGGSAESFEITSHVAVGREDMDGWSAYLHLLNKPNAEIIRHIPRENGQVLMLSIGAVTGAEHPGAGQQVYWNSTLKVSGGRYVRGGGYCADFPTAFKEVNAYQHESRAIGAMTWWKEPHDRWVSWLGETRLEANLIKGDPPKWIFNVSGEAPTFEEAALLASIHG